MTRLEPQYSGDTKLTNARMDVALIFGSSREERLCEVVAMWAAEQIWSQGRYSLDIIDPAALPMALFHQRKNDTELTASRRRLGNADAFVVVIPEYDYGYPAALKFLIDSADVEWHAKPVAFVAYGGASGGLRAVEQLKPVFAELHAVTVCDTVSIADVRSRFDASGHLLEPHRPAKAMTAMLKQLHWWAVALHAARKKQPYGLVTRPESSRRRLTDESDVRATCRRAPADRNRALRAVGVDDFAGELPADPPALRSRQC